jgi:hypothetical protein
MSRHVRGPIAALVVVLGVVAIVIFVLSRGGQPNDEQAVRTWFTTRSGGGAPPAAVSAIHVDVCNYTDATSQSHPVLKCPVTTDAPNPTLHTCFVISRGKVLRGGWQLANLDACNALRFDPRTGTLIDLAARRRYRLTSG